MTRALACCLFVVGSLALALRSAEPELVMLDASGSGFERAGAAWIPFGCNYFDPSVGWPPRLWREFDAERVAKHLDTIASLGGNVIRVFLTAASFFPDGEKLERAALEKFDRLLDLADRRGILVHPTGPDHWEGNPPWRRRDLFADARALETQARFWLLFAERYRSDPRIFAFDLLNEPHVSWSGEAMAEAWRRWLSERYGTLEALQKAWGRDADGLSSFDEAAAPPDAPSESSRKLADYQAFRESLAERWVRIQVESMRAAGSKHLVTVGLIQWSVPVLLSRPSMYAAFRPSQIVKHIDFLSIHFYPLDGDPLEDAGNFDRNLAYLEFVLRYVRAGAAGKPVFVGEFGWYGGGAPKGSKARSPEEQVRWCEAAVLRGRGLVAGWLNWAFADTPSSTDMSRFSGLVAEDGSVKPWGKAFGELARNPARWLEAPNAPSARFRFALEPALLDPASGTRQLRSYFEAWKAERMLELDVDEACSSPPDRRANE